MAHGLLPVRPCLTCPEVQTIFPSMWDTAAAPTIAFKTPTPTPAVARGTAVGHLDADCFYVSAERVRDAFLCEKAVGVLGNQGACVIAKSYEMKAAGVGTGMPIWDALVKCPMGVYIKRDFHWYEVLSRMMLE